MSIALTLLIGLGLANCALGPLESIDKGINRAARTADIDDNQRDMAKDKANQQVVRIAGTAIKWAIEPSDEQLDYLTEDKPAMVSAVIVLMFLATPFFACLGGFNQTSGDIGSKGLRYLLIRTERPNIFFGRFLGTLGFTAAVNLLLFAILAIYMAAKIKVHGSGEMMMWTMQGYLRMMIFTLPYIALCAWISSAIDSSFGSLAICLLVAFILPLVLGIAGGIDEHVKYGQYITPWGWKYWLLEPLGGKLFAGIGVMGAFAALFLWLGHKNFSTRDL